MIHEFRRALATFPAIQPAKDVQRACILGFCTYFSFGSVCERALGERLEANRSLASAVTRISQKVNHLSESSHGRVCDKSDQSGQKLCQVTDCWPHRSRGETRWGHPDSTLSNLPSRDRASTKRQLGADFCKIGRGLPPSMALHIRPYHLHRCGRLIHVSKFM
jgi:hypothetical protein